MENFLLLTDFSANANYAAEYCLHLARQMQTNVVLCNIIEETEKIVPTEFVAWPMEGDNVLEDLSNMKLFDLKKRLSTKNYKANHLAIGIVNSIGKMEEVLPYIIEDRDIAITVMGTHENGNVKNFFLSNHNQNMILRTTIPLLLVPPTAPIVDILKIAFATDLNHVHLDLDHIFALVALARPVNAEILIVHVGHEEKLSQVVKYENERLLTEISNKADYPNIYYKLLTSNSAEEGLQWLCEHEKIDLLAVAPRKRSFIAQLISPGLTKNIVKHLSIPLMIFPAK